MTSISTIWKQLTSILSNLNNFHSLEVVDRVSETQLQVGENSDWIICRLKGSQLCVKCVIPWYCLEIGWALNAFFPWVEPSWLVWKLMIQTGSPRCLWMNQDGFHLRLNLDPHHLWPDSCPLLGTATACCPSGIIIEVLKRCCITTVEGANRPFNRRSYY